jgi:hypothetical protein
VAELELLSLAWGFVAVLMTIFWRWHPGSILRYQLRYRESFSPRMAGQLEPREWGIGGGERVGGGCVVVPELRTIVLEGRKAPVEFPAATTEFAHGGTSVLSRPDPAWPCVVTLKCDGRVWTAHVDEEMAYWLEQFYTYGPMPDLPLPRNAWGIRPADRRWERREQSAGGRRPAP